MRALLLLLIPLGAWAEAPSPIPIVRFPAAPVAPVPPVPPSNPLAPTPLAADATPPNPIRFPNVVQPVPAPPSPPNPDTPTRLSLEQIFVVDSDVDVMVGAFPVGLLAITKEVGPLTVRAKFVDGTTTETRTFKGKVVVLVEAKAAGRASLVVVPVGAKVEKEWLVREIDSLVGPRPPPPDPPGPTPGPAPIPEPGFRVLIVYESADLAKLPSSQVAALNSKELRDYLNAKCTIGPDQKTREWRIWDRDTQMVGVSDLWRKAFARTRPTHPHILISTGTAGYEGPLPTTLADLMTILRKFGG